MNSVIIGAKESPRFEGEAIKWYEGDTFGIDWSISLSSVSDAGIETDYEFSPTDKVRFEFYNGKLDMIHREEFSPSQGTMSEGTLSITLEFNEEVTRKFPAGSYTYCVKAITKNGERVTTIGANNRIFVERCH